LVTRETWKKNKLIKIFKSLESRKSCWESGRTPRGYVTKNLMADRYALKGSCAMKNVGRSVNITRV